MSKLKKIIAILLGSDSDKKSHMSGSAVAVRFTESFVHCGCMDGDKIHDVTVHESFNGPSRKRKMCMFHIETEIEKGKIVSFD